MVITGLRPSTKLCAGCAWNLSEVPSWHGRYPLTFASTASVASWWYRDGMGDFGLSSSVITWKWKNPDFDQHYADTNRSPRTLPLSVILSALIETTEPSAAKAAAEKLKTKNTPKIIARYFLTC